MAAALPVNLSGVEEGADEDEEKERFDAEVRELPEDVLQNKKRRMETLIEGGVAGRLPDGGKKLRLKLDSICREIAGRQALSEAPHPNGGGPEALEQVSLPVNLSGVEEGADEEVLKERFDAEMRELSEDVLQEKKRRTETLIEGGVAGRLPDGGKKLRLKLDSICRELAGRQALSEAPHPDGGGPEALAQPVMDKGKDVVTEIHTDPLPNNSLDLGLGTLVINITDLNQDLEEEPITVLNVDLP